jgi:hypothetical protein
MGRRRASTSGDARSRRPRRPAFAKREDEQHRLSGSRGRRCAAEIRCRCGSSSGTGTSRRERDARISRIASAVYAEDGVCDRVLARAGRWTRTPGGRSAEPSLSGAGRAGAIGAAADLLRLLARTANDLRRFALGLGSQAPGLGVGLEQDRRGSPPDPGQVAPQQVSPGGVARAGLEPFGYSIEEAVYGPLAVAAPGDGERCAANPIDAQSVHRGVVSLTSRRPQTRPRTRPTRHVRADRARAGARTDRRPPSACVRRQPPEARPRGRLPSRSPDRDA